MSISKSPVQLTLAEGVPLFCLRDTDHKIGRLKLTFSVPSVPRRQALLALLGEVLVSAGKSCPGPSALLRRLDELYGASLSCYDEAVCGSHYFCVNCSFLPDFVANEGEETPFAGILSLLSEILCRPTEVNGGFDPTLFSREQASALSELSSLAASPSDVAHDLALRTATDGEGTYSSFSTLTSDVGSLTSAELYAFYRDTVRTSPLSLTYVGEREPSEAAETISEALSGLLSLSRPAWHTAKGKAPAVKTHPDVSVTFPCAQAQVRTVYRLPIDPVTSERRVASVLSALLGECVLSKYFVNVREGEHLCYSCSTFLLPSMGLLVGSAGTSEKEASHALRSMEKQLEAIRAGEISDAEWEAAMQYLSDPCRRMFDSTRSEMALLQSFATYEDRLLPDERIKAYRSVTREQVVGLARSLTRDTSVTLLPDGNAPGAGGAYGEEDDDDDE